MIDAIDALYTLSRYGNLTLRELMCIFKGDPTRLAEWLTAYIEMGYITAESNNISLIKQLMAGIAEMRTLDAPVDEKRTIARALISSHSTPDNDLRLILTSDGSVAAEGNLFLSPDLRAQYYVNKEEAASETP